MNSENRRSIPDRLVKNYFSSLVDLFFKILPMREEGEKSTNIYIESLMLEMLGCKNLIENIRYDHSYMTLLCILQYLIDNPDCKIPDVKREIFKAIRICNEISERYSEVV